MSSYDIRRYEYEQQKDEALRNSIAVSKLCAVISVDLDKCTVNVQPLSKIKIDGLFETPPPLLNIPVLKHRNEGGDIIVPTYCVGDIGVVIFCDHDIDNIVFSKAESEPASSRTHALDDGIFLGVI